MQGEVQNPCEAESLSILAAMSCRFMQFNKQARHLLVCDSGFATSMQRPHIYAGIEGILQVVAPSDGRLFEYGSPTSPIGMSGSPVVSSVC